MRRPGLGLCALLSLSACRPGGVPAPGALQKTFEKVGRSPACARELPMEWVSTWPIPTGEEGGRRFKALFYSLDRTAQDNSGMPRVRATQPRAEAVFSSEGNVLSCEVTPSEAKPLKGERYPDAAMRLEEDGFDKAVAKLFSLTETVSGYYARKSKSPDKKVLAEYWKTFALLAEPALSPSYYRANPDYWEWLRRENGQSLPRP